MLAIDGPRVLSIKADNRGLFEINFDRAVMENSATTSSLRISSAGKDGTFGTKDDVVYPLAGFFSNSDKTLTIYSPGSGVQQYRLQLLASQGLKGANGRLLDGEVGKNGIPSGNGAPGGDLDVVTRKQSKLYVRFYTNIGNMLARLYNTTAPGTVNNFLSYANSKAYDLSVFHRLMPGFVAQGGGFHISKHGAITEMVAGKKIKNEFGPSNVLGTIAMAKVDPAAPGGGPDTATDQFFFNLADNSANLDHQNGGFTVFGNVQNDGSLDVMKLFNTNVPVFNASATLGGNFTNMPVVNSTKVQGQGGVIKPYEDAILLTRVAVAMDVVALTKSTAKATAARAKPAAVRATQAAVTVTSTPSLFSAAERREDQWL